MFAGSTTTRVALVEAWLRRMGVPSDTSSPGPWWIRFDGSLVAIDLVESGGEAYTRIAALIATNTSASLDLISRLLALNNQMLMGAFRLLDDGTLAFSCTCVLDENAFESFRKTLEYVAQIGERFGPELQALGAGRDVLSLLKP
jgi:hypothetical protein